MAAFSDRRTGELVSISEGGFAFVPRLLSLGAKVLTAEVVLALSKPFIHSSMETVVEVGYYRRYFWLKNRQYRPPCFFCRRTLNGDGFNITISCFLYVPMENGTIRFCFFLRGVATQARDATARVRELNILRGFYYQKAAKARSAGALRRLIDFLFPNPIISVRIARRILNQSTQTASANLLKLVE